MKNKKKAKNADKPKRNQSVQVKHSEEIGSLKNIELNQNFNLNNAQENHNHLKADNDAIESRSKEMDHNARAFTHTSRNFGTQVHNQPKFQFLDGTVNKNRGMGQRQSTSSETNSELKATYSSKESSQYHPEESIETLGKLLASTCEGWLPIHVTTAINDVDKVRHYFQRDPNNGLSRCDPNGRCLNDGSTALLLAIRSKQPEAAKILLENGANVTLTDNAGDNALMAAIKSGDANVINIIWPFRGDLDINHTNYQGLSALHLAADRKWECCISFLLQNRANPNCQSMTGITPLMLAASNGDTKTVDILIKSGADMLLEDVEGYTCICKAINSRKDDIAQHILRKIPDDKRDPFVRSRLEMLTRPPNLDEEKRMLDCFYPVLHQCTEETEFRTAFYNSRAIQKVTQKLDEHDQNIELAISASHLLFCIMFGFSKAIDVKFVKQFIHCKGPEVVIRITKFFTEVWKVPEREIIIVFLPMLGLSELLEGRTWLKKNYVSVSEYLNFFERDCLKPCLTWNHECHWGHDCKYIDAINCVWLRFHDVMNEIQTEEREKHMAELLEEEAKEKEKQTRKREKKKQKKQEKQKRQDDSPELEKRTEREFNPHQNQVNFSEICFSSKNANTNAGQDDSKAHKKTSGAVDPLFQTTSGKHNIVEMESYQMNTDYPQQTLADMYYKPEQWTTIQTKRQMQKEKEKKCIKRQTEHIKTDVHEKLKKTPRKSPKKKNGRTNQNIFGEPAVPVIVSGNTRWADIAKGVAKNNVKPNTQYTSNKANRHHNKGKAKFGETDFPSLNVSEEESPNKAKSYIKPAKFTFNFHDPIVEQTPIVQDDCYENEEENITIGSNISGIEDPYQYNHNQPCAVTDEGLIVENETDTYDDALIENVEAEYCSVMENQDNEYKETQLEVNDSSINDTQSQIEERCGEHEYVTEDWSEEIEKIEQACSSGNFQESNGVQHPNMAEEVHICTSMEPHSETVKEMSSLNDVSNHGTEYNASHQDNECTSQTRRKGIDYVGPEHCQVDINAIIQHQTMSFPYFEQHILSNRIDDPFFDPDVPLPRELAHWNDKPPNTVDTLFEESEEIPCWFNDVGDVVPTQEETWTEMQEKTGSYANNEPVQQYSDGCAPLDPAIIGYKQMQTNQFSEQYGQCANHKGITPLREEGGKVIQASSPINNCYDQSLRSSYRDANETDYEPDNIDHLSKQEIENMEKQTAIIKPLQTKSKVTIPVSNSAFGQKLLENACRLEQNHHDDSISYPEELGGVPLLNDDENVASGSGMDDDTSCSSSDSSHFPGFHSGTKLSAHYNDRDVSIFHRMQQVQLEQLARYYKQCKQQIVSNTSSQNQDNFVYYASCVGLNRKDMEECLKGRMENLHMKSTAFEPTSKDNKTFKDLRKESEVNPQVEPAVATSIPTHQKHYNCQGHNGNPQMVAHSINKQMPTMPSANLMQMGQCPPPAMHPANIHMIQATQAAMAASVMNQIKEMYKSMMKAKMKSIRWREDLSKLRNLPPEKQMVVGKIVIPKDERDRIYISYTSSGPLLLGFQTDGTEVAVKVIDWCERDFTLDELQHLVNLDVSKYFMNKYKAFCSQDGHYFIAMDLHEYTLAEYLDKLSKDTEVDQAIARNKLVWQLMRGLASLHQHCLMVHGELRPENVVIDLDGNIRITGYGLGKNTNRDTPFIECNDDEKCWLAPEVLIRKQKVSFKSDIFVAGMLMYYILSGGKNPFGSRSEEIVANITEQTHIMEYVTEEAGHLLSVMLSVNKSERPCISDALRHPYFWADEKRLRFILISGSDVLRDLKAGIPMDGSVRDSMIGIIGTAPCNIRIINWIDDIESVIMREMRVFRQYKNNVVELVLFIYNCCLHFDKMSDTAREIIDEPCKYFLNKFSPLFMTVYRAIKMSNRTERTCYKPFF